MEYIRLKVGVNDEGIADRMKYNPEIIEFHLTQEDLEQVEVLREKIQYLKAQGVNVYLHHPMFFGTEFLDIVSENPDNRAYYDWSSRLLAKLCEEEDIYCVLHAHYTGSISTEITPERVAETIERIKEVLAFEGGNRFLWENTIAGIFSYRNERLIEDIVAPLNLPMTFDVSHAYISFKGDNDALEQALTKSLPYIKYCHVVDSKGQKHDSLPLGNGTTDWSRIKPHIAHLPFIFEIDTSASNHLDCTPMVESARYFASL